MCSKSIRQHLCTEKGKNNIISTNSVLLQILVRVVYQILVMVRVRVGVGVRVGVRVTLTGSLSR